MTLASTARCYDTGAKHVGRDTFLLRGEQRPPGLCDRGIQSYVNSYSIKHPSQTNPTQCYVVLHDDG
jgi:hypothetical protein